MSDTPFSTMFDTDQGSGDIPVYKDAAHGYDDLGKGVDSATRGDVDGVLGDIADFALSAAPPLWDPLGYLISSGLSFLIDFVQPLEDMIGLVTGNAERINADAAMWAQVSDDLTQLAEDIHGAVDQYLSDWANSGEAARAKLNAFAKGVEGIAGEVDGLGTLLTASAALMDAAKSMVIEVLAQLIEWLVVTWLAAQAAAIPTLGASEAAAAATVGETAVAVSRGAKIVSEAARILNKIRAILTKILSTINKLGISRMTLKSGGTAGEKFAIGVGRFGFDPVSGGITLTGAANAGVRGTLASASDQGDAQTPEKITNELTGG